MTLYHINHSGKPGPCYAGKSRCPFGGESGSENHFSTPEDAAKFYEDSQKNRLLPPRAYNARLPKTDLEMATSGNYKVRETVARSQTVDSKLLDLLAKDQISSVRKLVAENLNSSEHSLSGLSWDPEISVRFAVAKNPHNVEGMDRLCWDPVMGVRAAVAANSSTPERILEILSKDLDLDVRREVARNSSTDGEVLATMAKDPVLGVRLEVAKNVNNSEETLRGLLKDNSIMVRLAVIHNPRTHLDDIQAKTTGLPMTIQAAAKKAYKERQ